jgi:hypothetical protein
MPDVLADGLLIVLKIFILHVFLRLPPSGLNLSVCFVICSLSAWSEFASELYRSSDRRLSAKFVLTFADREVSRSQRGGSPTAIISVFYPGAAAFSFK